MNDFAGRFGGAETYINDMKPLLREGGHDVEVYFSRNTVKLDIFGSIFSIRNLIDSYKKIKSYNPDIIHVHKYNLSLSVSPLIVAKFLKKKTFVTFHDFGILCCNGWCVDGEGNPCKKPSSIKWLFCRSLSNKRFINKLYDYVKNTIHLFLMNWFVDEYIAPSKALTRYLGKIYDRQRRKRAHCVPNFKIISKKKLRKRYEYLVYVGRLTREKGVDWLINSFRQVVEKSASAKLVIVGGGVERKRLEALTKKLGLQHNIEFRGRLNYNELVKVYEKALAVVMPSIWMENNPMVLFEASSYAIPVIGSNIGGIPDMVKDGYNGYLVERFNSNQLAEKILTLIKNKNLAAKLGEIGKRLVEKEFSPQKHIKRLMLHYRA
ncbi:glycosyltransferase family 4 protein [Candidatus Woesearchaeota archaeon]|nr:glycosyltransferase family 4 protein [Candidatus Woesearchaeota archaeon]